MDSRKLQRLATHINWSYLESSLGHLFTGHNAPPLRLVIGLLYLQSIDELPYEDVITSFKQSPDWQAFCGMNHEENLSLVNVACLSIWSRVIGASGREAMTKALGM
ncbi:MAG: hypothetical protein ACPG47_05190 [Leucothrix sp.]